MRRRSLEVRHRSFLRALPSPPNGRSSFVGAPERFEASRLRKARQGRSSSVLLIFPESDLPKIRNGSRETNIPRVELATWGRTRDFVLRTTGIGALRPFGVRLSRRSRSGGGGVEWGRPRGRRKPNRHHNAASCKTRDASLAKGVRRSRKTSRPFASDTSGRGARYDCAQQVGLVERFGQQPHFFICLQAAVG